MNSNRRLAREEQWTSTGCVEPRLRDGCGGKMLYRKLAIRVEDTVVKPVE